METSRIHLPPPPPPAENPAHLLLPLLRSWPFVLFAAAVGVIGGLFVGAIRPNEYVSKGKLFLQLGQRERITMDTQASDNTVAGTGTSDLFNELHILGSPELFERVARKVGPARVLVPYDPASEDGPGTLAPLRWYHRFQSWWHGESPFASARSCPEPECSNCVRAATAILAKRTRVDAPGQSYILLVDHTSPDPVLGHDVLRVFLDEARVYHMEVFSPEEFRQGLQAQVVAATEKADRAEERYGTRLAECGIWDVGAESEEVFAEIRKLESDLFEQEARIQSLELKRDYLLARLVEEPETIEQKVPQPPVLEPNHQAYQDRLRALRAEVTALKDRYVEDAPPVRRKLEEIAALERERPEGPVYLVLDPVPIDALNPNRTLVEQEVRAIEADLHGLESARDPLHVRLQEQKERLALLQRCKPELESLQFDARMKRSEASRITASLEKRNLTNVLNELGLPNLRVIEEEKYPPLSKEGPDRKKFLLAGVLLGAFAGIGLSLLWNLVRPTITRPEDVDRVLGVPVLSVVPEVRGGSRPRPESAIAAPGRP